MFKETLLPFAVLGCLVASAATGAVDEETKEYSASIRLLSVNPLPGNEPLFYYSQGEYKKLTPVSSDFLGMPIRMTWTKEQGPALYRKTTPTPAEIAAGGAANKPPYVPVIAWRPVAGKRQMVLLLPKKDSVVAVATTDNEGDFPFGRYLVHNFSTKHLTFDFGGSAAVFKPGTSGLIPPAKKTEQGQVFVRAAYSVDKAWQPFLSTFWTTGADTRTFLFVFDDPEGKSVRIRGIPDVNNPDVLEAAEPASKAKPKKK